MRRLIPFGAGVVALLVVVALAARGGALHSGGGAGSGSGPSDAFWNYAFTTVIIFAGILVALTVYSVSVLRPNNRNMPPHGHAMWALVGFIFLSVAVRYVVLKIFHGHVGPATNASHGAHNGTGKLGSAGRTVGKSLAFQWPELIVVLAAILAVAAVIYVRWGRNSLPSRRREADRETLAQALDLSLDDLRADPDLRRAIIAAYARMERTFAAAGNARRPSETPLEYLERALISLDASAEAVRRLTDLFEWARFSHHEPEPAMRDEAVDALVAVRDELRSAELIPA